MATLNWDRVASFFERSSKAAKPLTKTDPGADDSIEVGVLGLSTILDALVAGDDKEG